MTIGPRIKLARVKAKMSMRQLAERVGVSATAISKFERGDVTPRQSTLLRLAKVLSVGVEFFFREAKVEALTPAYRKHSKLGKLAQDAIEATIVEAVERYLTAEQLFPGGSLPKSEWPRFLIKGVEDAEQSADELREEWNLGSAAIGDLCGQLEDRGVTVVAVDGPEGFDGFSCWADRQVPVIAFNSNVAGDRQRFDLAHELGHLVLESDPSTDLEKVAHRFAAAFLVPAKAARSELGRKRTNLSFDELLLLKREYGMSVQAWIRRAFDLGIIDESTYSVLCRRLTARGWRTKEPDGVRKESPKRLRLLVHQALAEKLITPSFAATLLGETAASGRVPANRRLSEPTEALVQQYASDPELTAFTDVDLEDFHEEDR